jgi:2-amino-4-hydroxy-6-hydroxymethyldihydropteridine diphosphokinase
MRLQALRDALAHLDALKATRVVRHSSLYRSAPVDSSGPDYINAVAELATRLTAPELLAQLQQLELAAGRERPYRNAPRTLDLDLAAVWRCEHRQPAIAGPPSEDEPARLRAGASGRDRTPPRAGRLAAGRRWPDPHALTSRVIARMTHRPDHQAIARFVNKRRFL